MSNQLNIPTHIAIIMDGNGRWATREGVEKIEGHKRGVDALRRTVGAAQNVGVKFLTVYAFSTENWGRPQDEVVALMELFSTVMISEASELAKNGVRLSFIGNTAALSDKLQAQIREVETMDIDNERMMLVVAINYSARWDIVRAATRIARRVGSSAVEIDAEMFAQELSTSHLPDVDLLIRTSAEQRLSNFMLWECSYAELYFTDVLWPDFDAQELNHAIEWYSNRERRFGVRK